MEKSEGVLRETVPQRGAVPGRLSRSRRLEIFLDFTLIAMSFARDGCFYGKGLFRVVPRFNPKDLRAIFEHRVLRILLSMGKITRDIMNSFFCHDGLEQASRRSMECINSFGASGFYKFNDPGIDGVKGKGMIFLSDNDLP